VTALLLDEMLSPRIAEQLVAVGYDVLAISAVPELRGTPDADVLDLAAKQGRVLITANIKDFAPVNAAWAAQGRTHPGMVFVSAKRFPAGRDRIGRLSAALRQRCVEGRWPAPGQFDFL
jgi:hypothetical protein